MAYILSTGTAMTIAAATGDAGQLGMALGFSGSMLRLIRTAVLTWVGLDFTGLIRGGSDALHRCLHYLTQPSVYQH
jgi:ABC-type arginine transport system permease subunit